jgi:hypothetical protein
MIYDELNFEYQEFAIGGRLITGSVSVSDYDLNFDLDKQDIKERLLKELVDKILEQNLAEFTMVQDPVNNGRVYRVRCYLAPDSTVKVLRVHTQKNIT